MIVIFFLIERIFIDFIFLYLDIVILYYYFKIYINYYKIQQFKLISHHTYVPLLFLISEYFPLDNLK
jgi:hypothetical protein